jgi:hypothetical protein
MGNQTIQASQPLVPLNRPASASGPGVSRVLAETGLSLGVGFATDGIYRNLARSGKGGALVVGLVAAASLKAAGTTMLDVLMGAENGRSKGQAALDGLRTGLIDGSLALGSRRISQGVAARMPNARPVLRVAVTGATMGSMGGAAYSATDPHTWQHGVAQGLTVVGKNTAFGMAGGFALGGTAGYVAQKAPAVFRALHRSPAAMEPTPPVATAKPVVATVKPVEPVVVAKSEPVPKTVQRIAEPKPKVTRQERIQQYQKTAVTGTVVEGAATKVVTKATVTDAATGQVSVGVTPAKTVKPASPAFKGDPYHPDVVDNRIAEWQKLYGESAVTRLTRMTKLQATEAADKLGFEMTNYTSHGQPVFRSGNRYITPDVDGHNGGMWKMADSHKALGSKTTRMGTYDAELNRIGD